ncbi:hypothetical protein RMCBS344292_06220 [Rhizopus microsporus]|nr:hypothetical protein RMCBS344292_06220 [Rhizopus microsporus]
MRSFSLKQLWNSITLWIWTSFAFLTLVLMLDSSLSQKLSISQTQRKAMHSCDMTYIYPTYIRVEHQPKTTFSKKYTLYLYREGFIDSEELVGVPVLFIPGQAGSYKQVRSLASESSKYSHTQKNVQDLNWFTLDLNEELTAFSGQHVLDQANYANTAIQTILNLYHGRVDSVIIVGHSMGGIVARTLMMLPNYVPNSVRTILTLATPHTSAPVLLDPVIYRLYQDLSRFWGPSQFTKEGKLRNVTLVSIAGGSLDNIVHSDSTGVHSIVPESHGFAIFSTSIPFVWTESDHMAILWCNQLVKRLAATLVNIHDHAMSVHGRMDILKQHLLETKSSSLITHHSLSMPQHVQVIDMTGNNSHLFFTNTNQPRLTVVKYSENLKLLTDIPEESDHKWLLVSCKKVMDDWSCQPLNNASVTILPSASSPTGSYRYFTPSSSEPIEYVGILEQAKITLQDNNASFFIIYNDEATVHWSSTWDIVMRRKDPLLIAKKYVSRHVFPQLRSSLFAYDLHLKSSKPGAGLIPLMVRQTVNGQEPKYYRQIKENESVRITFHQATGAGEGLAFSFYTDNQAMELVMRFDWYATLGRCLLRYGSVMLNFMYVCTLIILITQCSTYVHIGSRKFVSYKAALLSCMKSYFIHIAALLLFLSSCQYYVRSHQLIMTSYLPLYSAITKDAFFGSDEPMFILVTVFLFMLSVGLTSIVWLLISFLTALLNKLIQCMYRVIPVSTTLQTSSWRHFFIHASIVLALVRLVPISVLIILYYIIWLIMTAASCTSSNLPSLQNTYRYRQSWLMFLTSLLPYHVPGIIVYIKNILAGWTRPTQPLWLIMQQLPTVFIFIYLVTLGDHPKTISPR